MFGGGVSIAVVMKRTAIIALNLTIIRFVPALLSTPPFITFFVLALDLALVHLAFDRPLRTFYFTFLIVGALSTGAVTFLASGPSYVRAGSMDILEAAIPYHRDVQGQGPDIPTRMEFPLLATGERFETCILGLLLTWAAAVLASWWVR